MSQRAVLFATRSAGALLFGAMCALWAASCNEIVGIEDGILSSTGSGASAGAAGSAGATGGAAGNAGTAGAGGTGSMECAPGTTQICYDGDPKYAGKGICALGMQTCDSGAWSPCIGGDTLPAAETCDGEDNDCDGIKDNGCACEAGQTMDCFPFGGGAMPGNGPCLSGTQKCDNGTWSSACDGAVGPDTETCANKGADDDCDGAADNVKNEGMPCSTGMLGACSAGHFQCSGAATLTCVQDVSASTEECNSLDDDCDGTADNLMGTCSVTVAGKACSGVNACAGPGTKVCTSSTFLSDDFSMGDSWTASGEWAIGPAVAGGGAASHPDPGADHSPSADNRLAGVAIGGDVSVQPGSHYLTSKDINLVKGGLTTATLTFYRWLNSDNLTKMASNVQVSKDNGMTWTTLWQNTDAAVLDNNWTKQSFDITPYMAEKFRFRFGVTVVSGTSGWSSWNIDDVTVTSCPLP